MQSNYTGHIPSSEWRWVFFTGVWLLLLTILPLLIVALRSLEFDALDANAWQFMGAIHGISDAPALMSRMLQGAQGNWMTFFLHTPDVHASTLTHPLYTLLGQVSHPSTTGVITTFHLARLTATLVMYVAIYHLGASIWVRVRSRRVFFMVASLGSGFGWLVFLFTGDVDALALITPQVFPFTSTIVNVHYPLVIACLASLVAVVISVLRPGNDDEPSVNNTGLAVFIVSLSVAFILPEALLPFALAVILSVVIHWFNRGFSQREVRWVLWILVPATPIVMYYIIITTLNPAVENWIQQRALNATTMPALIIGVLLPLLIALPGIWRALRHFEADGDRFMLLWLGAMLLIYALPLPIKDQALTGLMLPIAYFATRGAEDFWFKFVTYRRRVYVYVTFLVMLLTPHIFSLMLPILPIINTNQPIPITVKPTYATAFEWLSQRVDETDVILASPRVSVWIPLWTGARTYYGHPFETIQASNRADEVLNWYRAQDEQRCADVLYWQSPFRRVYPIRYVIWGVHEQALGGDGVCLTNLTPIASFEDVVIYTTRISPTTPP